MYIPFPVLSNDAKVKVGDRYRLHFFGTFPGLSHILNKLHNVEIDYLNIKILDTHSEGFKFSIDIEITESDNMQKINEVDNESAHSKLTIAPVVIGAVIVAISTILIMFTFDKAEKLFQIKPVHAIGVFVALVTLKKIRVK